MLFVRNYRKCRGHTPIRPHGCTYRVESVMRLCPTNDSHFARTSFSCLRGHSRETFRLKYAVPFI
jgi:hypothetical protein